MHLALLVAVVVTVCCAETSKLPLFVEHLPTRTSLFWISTGVGPVLAFFVAWITLRGIRRDSNVSAAQLQQWDRLRAAHVLFWLLGVGIVQIVIGWPHWVRREANISWPFVDHLLMFLPVLLPIVLSWIAFYQVDRELAIRSDTTPVSLLRYLGLHTRHYFGLVVAPIFALLVLADIAELVSPGVTQSQMGMWLFFALLIGTIVSFPWLMRVVWKTRSLPAGPLRTCLEANARRAGIHLRDVLVWNTGSMSLNAAVIGFLPRWRYVLLTDALVEHFDQRQAETVFAHEIGHLKHHHLWLRVLSVFATAGAWLFVAGSIFSEPTNGWGALALAALLALVMSWYSRLLEHQADVAACQLLQTAGDVQIRPDERVASLLESLQRMTPGQGWLSRWLHPSFEQRISFVRRLSRDPHEHRRFEGRLKALACLIVGLAAMTMAMLLGGV